MLLLFQNNLAGAVSEVKPIGGGGLPKRRIYVVDDELRIFVNRHAQTSRILNEINGVVTTKKDNKPQAVKQAIAPVIEAIEPSYTVDLQAIKALYEQNNQKRLFERQLKQQQYEQLLKVFEDWQDEQEIELLLLAA